MSFINLQGINTVKEAPTAPEGRYALRIISAKMHETDTGQSIQTVLEIEGGEERYANVFHYVALPNGKDANKDVVKLLMAKRFFTQFGVPIDGEGVEIEQLVGNAAEGYLKVDVYNNQPKNVFSPDPLPA